MRGYTDAGVYASAYNLAQYAIGTLLSGIGLASLPLAVATYRLHEQSSAIAVLERNLLIGIGVGLPAVVGLGMLASQAGRVLLGNYVAGQSSFVTMIIAIAIGFAAVRSYCLDPVFMLHERTWLQTAVVGSSAALNVGLNLALIPRWGAIGAAFASLAAFVCALVASWLLGRRYMRLHLSVKDTGAIALGCALMALVLIGVSSPNGHWPCLVVSVAVGALVYGCTVVGLNVAGSRVRLVAFVRDITLGR
ncbi:MAG: oligosaccharide flippase family protein, partial [Gammaproteobacteria bacterium]